MRSSINPLNSIKRRKAIQNFVIAVFVIAVFFLLFPLMSRIVFFVASPLWKASDDVNMSMQDEFAFIVKDKRALIEENRDLKEQIKKYESVSQSTSEKSEEKAGVVVGDIYAKPPASPYDTYLVNKGSRHGLSDGDGAYASDRDFIVGFIEQVYTSHSLVRSFSHPGFEVNAFLDEGMEVTLVGMGGGMFTVILPMDVEIKEGRYVRYADRNLPVLGIVVGKESNDVEGLQRIFVRQVVPINSQKTLSFYLDL